MSPRSTRHLASHPLIFHLAIAMLLFALTGPAAAIDDHLLICEAAQQPTSDEFIEIVNPTGLAVDLTNYYLSDDEDYALVPGASGAGPAPSIGSSDFIAQFPPGSSIPADGGVVVIAFDGAGFFATFGFRADFEIAATDAMTPDMIATDVGASAGLTNGGENVVLFFWDGASDLIQDVDAVNLGTPSSTNDLGDKTGITVDGPDADTTASMYATDMATMPLQAADHGFGESTKRMFLEATFEINGGGNGITGDDETTEDITMTWDSSYTAPTPGTCDAMELTPVLILNEFQADPDAANGDANGDGSVDTSQDEFVELYNDSGFPLDITGWTLSDAVGLRHTFPPGSVIPDQCALVVFGGGTPTGSFGNAAVQTASGGFLGLNNGGDSIIINDGMGDQVMVTYGSEGGNNQSLTLDPDITGSLFTEHSVATGSGGVLFSPGTMIDGTSFVGCPTAPPAEWIINEIHADPDATNGDANGDGSVSTTQDEFVEIFNDSGAPADISGWTVSDAVGVKHTFPAGTVVPDQCAVVVFGGGTPTGTFEDAVVQTASTGGLGLTNGGDSVILNDGTMDVAVAMFGSEGGNNESINLDPDLTGAPPYVLHSTVSGANGIFSPGTLVDDTRFSGCLAPASGWIVNEIHADPDSTNGDANGDGTVNTSQDEFFELYNATGADADISGWTMSDAVQVRHTFPGGTVVPDQCSIVVFGAGTPTGPFGGSIVQTASSGSVGLNNGGDTVTINDGTMDVAVQGYGGEGGDNQSLTLSPDVLGLPPLVRHSTAPGSGGTLFSPGTQLDGGSFIGCPPPPSGVVINELHADPDATNGDANGDGSVDTTQDEFVEIVNTSGGDLDISGWTLSDAAQVRHTFPAGSVLPDQCAVVVFGGGTPTGEFGNVLVQTASTGQLGLNNGGDTLTINDTVSDIEMATYGSEGGDNQSLTLDPDIVGMLPRVKHSEVAAASGALFSPGTRVDGVGFFGCPVGTREIFEIQGNGNDSPFAGQTVTTLSNIVTAVGTDRFFMQTPDARDDMDPSTSNGIVVFTGSAPAVSVGDEVDVTGEVVEFFGLTEFSNSPMVMVMSSANGLPSVVDFDASTPSTAPMDPSDLERFEGMRVRMMDGTTSAPTDGFGDTFVVANTTRLFREPGILFPGLPGLPVWDGNPEAFEIDPDGVGQLDDSYFANLPIAAEGVLTFSFGDYQLLPTAPPIVGTNSAELPPLLPRPVRPRNPGEISIGTQNMLRFFDDVDDGIGEPVPSAMEYQERLEKLSAQIRTVLGSPEVLAVQEVENLNALNDLAAQILSDDPSVVYSSILVEGNDVGGIDVGFMIRDTISALAVTQIGANEIFAFDGSLLNDRPPLVLEARYNPPIPTNGPIPPGFDFTVMVVHNRSLSGIDDDMGSGPRVRMKRQAQAEFISGWIGARQMSDPMERLIITGDFNAYEFTDGYADVLGQIIGLPADASQAQIPGTDDVDPNLTSQILNLPQDERYSFIFGESAQALDHFLTSVPANAAVVEMQFGRGNADVSDDFEDMPMTPLRSSDHDGAVLFLEAQIPLPPLQLTIDGGVCPGLLSFTLEGAAPNARVAVMGAFDTGSAVVERGPCFGTTLGLDEAKIVRRVQTDGSGQASFQRFLTFSRCSQLFQLMELPSDRIPMLTSGGSPGLGDGPPSVCRTSPVESVPVATPPVVLGGGLGVEP